MATACHLRFPEINIATIPLLEERSARLLGKANAMEFLTAGELIGLKDALEIGLLNDIFLDETFSEEILEVPKKDSQKESSRRARSVRFGHSWCR